MILQSGLTPSLLQPSEYVPPRRSRNWCLHNLGASEKSKPYRAVKVENISWCVNLWKLFGRMTGRMLNHFSWTSDCVMFLQFSSPSLAPVCGTNCPKTDAFSAYDGCVFGIGVCVFGIVWNYAQKSPMRFPHRGMYFRNSGMRFQHPKNVLNHYINAFLAYGYAFLALSGTMFKNHVCVCDIGLRKFQCVFSIDWIRAKKMTKNYHLLTPCPLYELKFCELRVLWPECWEYKNSKTTLKAETDAGAHAQTNCLKENPDTPWPDCIWLTIDCVSNLSSHRTLLLKHMFMLRWRQELARSICASLFHQWQLKWKQVGPPWPATYSVSRRRSTIGL